VAEGQTKAAEGGCRAEQPCEPRSIAAASLLAAGPKYPVKIDLLSFVIALAKKKEQKAVA